MVLSFPVPGAHFRHHLNSSHDENAEKTTKQKNKRTKETQQNIIIRRNNDTASTSAVFIRSCREQDFRHQLPQDWLVDWPVAETSHVTAHSAASSRALLRFLPSYQYLAANVWPWTVTLLDQAVRPPANGHELVSHAITPLRQKWIRQGASYLGDQIQFGKQEALVEHLDKTLVKTINFIVKK